MSDGRLQLPDLPVRAVLPALGAALAADRIIVTRDDALRRALAERADGTALLQSLKWINPVTDGAEALKGL